MKQIPLSKTGKVNAGKHFALVDDEDFEYLNQWNWSLSYNMSGTQYAESAINGKRVKMHRVLLGLTNPKIFGDHKDLNGLNNQRDNIRVATQTENNRNKQPKKNGTSQYLGVMLSVRKYKESVYTRWYSQITIKGKKHHIGSFKIEEDAAKSYDKRAKIEFGEFANLNFK